MRAASSVPARVAPAHLPQFPHFCRETESSAAGRASTPVRSTGRVSETLPGVPSGRLNPTGCRPTDDEFWRTCCRSEASGWVVPRLNPLASNGATLPATCGIGRMDGCCLGESRVTEGVIVESGRVDGLNAGRVDGVAFGCVREGVGRGVI